MPHVQPISIPELTTANDNVSVQTRKLIILIFSTFFLNSQPTFILVFSSVICTILVFPSNAEALVVATKETGLEVNADKTKYMIVSRDQNAGRSHNMKIDNASIERVEDFKYLGKTLNQNSIQEEIKSRLKLGNACYSSVQNLLSSSLLSRI